MLGRYKPSQVELLIEIRTIGCRDLYLPVRYAPPVVPAFEIQPQAFRFATPDILHGVAASIASFRRPLAWLTFPEPVPHVIDIVAMYVRSRWVDGWDSSKGGDYWWKNDHSS